MDLITFQKNIKTQMPHTMGKHKVVSNVRHALQDQNAIILTQFKICIP